MAPHGIYPCAGDDDWIAIACRHQADWQAFAGVVDEGWCGEPQFTDLATRLTAQDELDARISAWTAPQGKFEVEDVLRKAGVPVAAVMKPEERIDRDPSTATSASGRRCGTPRWAMCGWMASRFTSQDRLALAAWRPLFGRTHRGSADAGVGLQRRRSGGVQERGSDLTALAGLKVVELAQPPIALAGKLLADMGADVILVEPPGGDPSRNYPRFWTMNPAQTGASIGGTTTPASAAW